MREKILIYGGGGHAKTIIGLIRQLNSWQIAGIIDDGLPAGTLISGVPVLGNGSMLAEMREVGIHSAVNTVGGIGDYSIRWKVFESLIRFDFDFPTFIHPASFIEADAVIEAGVQVLPMSYISSEAQIGFGSLINANVVVSHDCRLGRCVNLSPGAMIAGNAVIDDFAQIGMNATVNLNVRVGKAARVGNSAVVKGDVPDQGRVYAGQVWPIKRFDSESRPEFYRKIA